MKILVISDSHGNIQKLKQIIEAEKTFDWLIHCGDGINDLIHVVLPKNVQVITVCGNIDRARGINGSTTIVENIKGYKFFITHGDLFGAHHDITGVWSEATRLGCDIACFGHTHRAMNDNVTPYMFNPGAAQSGMYGTIEITSSIRGELKKV
ncbi:MAG: YfcE family phosphodiesterase [Spirochaetes bacterium]|nr:YfcE family phosphodiesterase [Spirochaetota bacterium]